MSRTATEKKSAQQPERKCIATGEVQPKYGLIRFVVGPDQMVVPDVLEKLPGRGWVDPNDLVQDDAEGEDEGEPETAPETAS